MVKYEIKPHQGIGPVHFGMTHREVYEAMRVTPSALLPRGKKIGEERTGFFHINNCCNVSYSNTDSTVCHITISNLGDIEVFYEGIDLFNTEADHVIALISTGTPQDKTMPEAGYLFVFPALELALWRDSIPEEVEAEGLEEQDPIYLEEERRKARYFSSVSLGTKGYYSEDWEGVRK